MALFVDCHQDLKLPAEALAQIAGDTSRARADGFGVHQAGSLTWPGRTESSRLGSKELGSKE
jgi:hypothetical protein